MYTHTHTPIYTPTHLSTDALNDLACSIFAKCGISTSFDTRHWPNFSKVSFQVIASGKFSSELTFQKFCLRHQAIYSRVCDVNESYV